MTDWAIVEWLAGFKVTLDIAIIGALIVYMVKHRQEMGSAAYCIATALIIWVSGNTLSNSWVWFLIHSRHDLLPQEKVGDIFPIVGSWIWRVGAAISAVGLVKAIREFSGAYVGEWLWIIALVLGIVVPLFLIWY